GVDRARADAELLREFFDNGDVVQAVREIPLNVEGHGFAGSGEGVDLCGVAEFFFDASCGGGLNELPETSAGVGEAPGGKLDVEAVKDLSDCFDRAIVHGRASVRRSIAV